MDVPRDEQAGEQAELSQLGVTTPTRASDPGGDTVSGDGASASAGEPALLAPHTVVGRYIVLGHLGSGGMGVVYKAYDPDLNRQVALKLVRVALDGAAPATARGRLLREAQGLAQLSHPNVVAVYDVGLFDDGVFLAMELVQGPTLRAWLKTQPRYRDKLRVFVAAGEGLAAAHRAGLVHRDVKPDNIILGADGRPRVLDFGLVRAVDDVEVDVDSDAVGDARSPDEGPHEERRLRPAPNRSLATHAPLATHASLAPLTESSSSLGGSVSEHSGNLSAPLTRVGAVLGTPRYMSPEQLLGRSADAKSDQFSFCVALYEAVYGQAPFRGKTLHVLRDNICAGKVRPPPARSPVPAAVRRAILKGLAPDPYKRHESVAALLAQLGRDPARVRRRALAIAAVVSSLGFGTWSAIAGRHAGVVAPCSGARSELAAVWNSEPREAVKQAFLASGVGYAGDTFTRVASVLDAYGERWVSMRTQACEATQVRGVQSARVLDLRIACLDRKLGSLRALVNVLAGAPDREVVTKAVEASLGLGAIAFCADVKALEAEVEPPERLEDRKTLAELRDRLETVSQLGKLAKYRETTSLLEELDPRARALGFPPLLAELAYHTAQNLGQLGKYAEAESVVLDAIQLALQWGMKELVVRAEVLAASLIGHFLQRNAEGRVYALHAQGLTRGRGDELEASALRSVATVAFDQGRYPEAEQLYQRALAILEGSLGPDHPAVATALYKLAVVYRNQGNYEQAATLHRRAIAVLERALGPAHPAVAAPINNLAAVYWNQGKLPEAEALYTRSLAIETAALGPDHPAVAQALNNLATAYHAQEKYAQAEQMYGRSLAIKEATLGPDHPDIAFTLNNLAELYRTRGDYSEAKRLNERSLAIFEKAHGPDHVYVAWSLIGLADAYEKQRRFAEALPLLERARQIRDRGKVAPMQRAEVAFALCRVLSGLGRDAARARSLANQALALYQAAGPGADKVRADVADWLATHPSR